MSLKLVRFFRQPFFVQAWFLPVWLGLGLARLAISTLAFKRLVSRLGVSVGVHPWLPLVEPGQENRARWIGQVVRQAARVTPWDSNCFPQTVVARVLLGWYGVPYCVFFGVRRKASEGAFDAHAWVAAGRVKVVGGWSFNKYAVVGVFISPQLTKNN